MTPALRRARARALGSALTCVFVGACVVCAAPLAYATDRPGFSAGTTAPAPDATATTPAAPTASPSSTTPSATPSATGDGTAAPWRPWPGRPGHPAPAPTGTGSGTGSAPGPAAAPDTGPTDAPAPSGSASLAGRPAGEGRPRPGRSETAGESAAAPSPGPSRTETATDEDLPDAVEEEDEGVREEEALVPEAAPASLPATGARMAPEASPTLGDQRIPVLTLGAGLALMGLGIGFLGLRMRRR
ncbi:hypothetical protein ACGFYZ_17755 [Streptomyces sp. NPDC048330]|uniref:hypothetical protein n=1 Tax=Streptomyces sp. NPDC048330 TaxID=3365533 RepID=UPI00371EDAAE